MNIKQLDINLLNPYDNNARIHSNQQIELICASIKEYGFTNPILIDENNNIIAGHGRLEAAKKLKLKQAPCIVLSGLTEKQKRAYIIADNKIALNSSWNEELLKLELQELKNVDFDLRLTGFDDAELSKLFDEDAENIIKNADEFSGDISDKWQLLTEYDTEEELMEAFNYAQDNNLKCKIIQ